MYNAIRTELASNQQVEWRWYYSSGHSHRSSVMVLDARDSPQKHPSSCMKARLMVVQSEWESVLRGGIVK